MSAHNKILRVFRLIKLLTNRPRKTVAQLARTIELDERSVYRYFELLEDLGYDLDKDNHNRYFIVLPFSGNTKYLDIEEKGFLLDLLVHGASDHPLATGIKQKLELEGNEIPNANDLLRLQIYQHIKTIREAMRLKVCIKINNYHSLSSGIISDRYLEPIHIDDGYTYLFGFDTKKSQARQYHLERIESIEIIETKISGKHSIQELDHFGFSAGTWKSVSMELSPLAHTLLVEEYPATASNINPSVNQRYVYSGRVKDWRGIGRFILGLPGEIFNVQPESLREYLNGCMLRSDWT